MRRLLMIALAIVFLIQSAHARLDESVKEIETRYGHWLKYIKPEFPATTAGLYMTNGFCIVVGFYQNKSYYELFQKIDPKNPKAFTEITELEREMLLKANCKGCNWTGHVTAKQEPVPGELFKTLTIYETTYDRSDNLAKATYDSKSRILAIRLLHVEKLAEEDARRRQEEEKKRQQENLKGF